MLHQIKTNHNGIRDKNKLTREKANSEVTVYYIKPDPKPREKVNPYSMIRPGGGKEGA